MSLLSAGRSGCREQSKSVRAGARPWFGAAVAYVTGGIILGIAMTTAPTFSQQPSSEPALIEEVQRILAAEASVKAVESLKDLGIEAVPALIEQLYERPEEILDALGALGDMRATYPVLDYLAWALRNRPDMVSRSVITLEELGDPRAVPRLRELIGDSALDSSLRLRSAEAVLDLAEGDDATAARRHLLETMGNNALDTKLRIHASRILLEKGAETEVSQAERFLFEVYEGTRLRFEGSQPVGEQPFVTLHTGGATELIHALAKVGAAEATEKIREWLARYPSNIYEANDMIEHLLKAPTAADVNAILTYVERGLEGEPGLQVMLLERLVSKDLMRDGRRLRRILEPEWERMTESQAENHGLPPDIELQKRVEKLLQVARMLEENAAQDQD